MSILKLKQVLMLTPLLITLPVSALLSWWLAQVRGRLQVLDTPNDRSMHTRPTPRTGGIAILSGSAAGLAALWLHQDLVVAGWPLFGAVIALALIAIVDDYHAIGIAPRLLVQFGAVALLLVHYRSPGSGLPLDMAAFLFLVWMINLYNFMDGMDGFATGMAIFGFATFAILGREAGQPEFAAGCAIVATACAGFLLLNFPPARLFMGDIGSTVLGLLAGITILQAHRGQILPVWLGVLVFSPFIVDATVTLVLRMLRRERFWKPHKTHFYQRLVQKGWGHRRTVLAEYTLMLACCVSALGGVALPTDGQIVLIAIWAVLYAGMIGFISHVTAQDPADT
ncbi:MAG TPA: glycosyltransferase family 4 protein [Gammaproteobacteria bacterium]|nr:glycosyltransferase family 4 protein [Gammaproteobacteria bacterium]